MEDCIHHVDDHSVNRTRLGCWDGIYIQAGTRILVVGPCNKQTERTMETKQINFPPQFIKTAAEAALTDSHSIFSPSGVSRWSKCTASIPLEQTLLQRGVIKSDEASHYADEGTKAHALAEGILTTGVVPPDDDFENDEMKQHVLAYVDYVRKHSMLDDGDTKAFCEKRLNDEKVPELFGTCDYFAWCPKLRTLRIFDLKYGAGIAVNVVDNPQLKIYAWMAGQEAIRSGVATKEDLEAASVEMHIFQPRTGYMGGRAWHCSYADIGAWMGQEVYPSIENIFKGEVEFQPGPKQCRFCSAKAHCKANAEMANVSAAAEFAMKDLTKVTEIPDTEIADLLKRIELMTALGKSLQERAQATIENGGQIPRMKMVIGGRSIRFWTEQGTAILEEIGDDVVEKKLMSPARVEKQLGKKLFAEMFSDEHIARTRRKPTLVFEDDPRPSLNEEKNSQAAEVFGAGE